MLKGSVGSIIRCARLSHLRCIASYEKQDKAMGHYTDFKIAYWHFSLILKASGQIRGLNWPPYRRLQFPFSGEMQRVTTVAGDYKEIQSIIALFSVLLWEYICFKACTHMCVIKVSSFAAQQNGIGCWSGLVSFSLTLMCVIQVSDRMVTSPNLQGGSYFGFSAIMTSSLFIVDTVFLFKDHF